MRIEKPLFPLTGDAFAAALRTGHGRARQQIDTHGSAGLNDLIVQSCLTCLTYDPQCEAERAPWVLSIVERAKLETQVVQAIEAAAQKPVPEDHRHLDHRSAILKELAAAGSDPARQLLYSSLVRLPHTSDVVGAEQIVALDGVDGLIRVARQLGRWLQADPEFWVDDGLMAQFDASTQGERSLAALEREAKVDAGVASYLASVRKICERRSVSPSRVDATSCSGAGIVAHVHKNPTDPCHWFRRWGAQAGPDERETVFAALLASDDPEHAKRFFRCFSKTGVPRFDGRLLRWIDHPDPGVRWAAVKALAPIKHVELRQAAMRLMVDGDMANGIALLVHNFEGGDFAVCAEHLKPLDDPDEAHPLGMALLDLCEAHPGADALDCLLYVYEFSPCSTCRRRAVKALTHTHTVPAWVLAESAFDADPETQAAVALHLGVHLK